MITHTDNAALLQKITDPMREGVIIICSEGRIKSANAAVEELFGYSEDELLNQNVKMLMPQEHSDNHDQYIDNYMSSHQPKIIGIGRDVKGLHKNGDEFHFNLRVSEIKLSDETYFLGYIHSTQQQVDDENEIKYQKELLERAEKVANIGHWSFNLQTQEIFWSKEIYNIHGVDEESYTPEYESAVRFYHDDDIDGVVKALEHAIDNKADFLFDARIVQPSGDIRHVRSSGECSFDDKQNVVGLFGVFQDITDIDLIKRKLIETEYAQQAFADASNDGFWDWHIQDEYVYMSSSFWEMFGFEPEEKKHHPREWQSLIFEDDLKIVLDNFYKHVETKGKHPFSQEVRYRHKNGSTVHVICKGKVVEWSDDNEPLRMIGTHTNITSLKETESALNIANKELEEFAYRTSHDLRSPLVSSIALLDIIDKTIEAGNVSVAKQSVSHIRTSLNKLEQLVEDILELTKAKYGEEEDVDIDVSNIIHESIDKISHLENFDRLKINIDLHDVKHLKTKESRFRLIIENLLSNAAKYQDLDMDVSHINITMKKGSGVFTLEVSDNGLGIPGEQQDKIFTMFARFHTNVSFGSGLGLYMMKKSADIMGGHLEYVPSQKGCTFRLSLPQ